jgi:hypothetical protein
LHLLVQSFETAGYVHKNNSVMCNKSNQMTNFQKCRRILHPFGSFVPEEWATEIFKDLVNPQYELQ